MFKGSIVALVTPMQAGVKPDNEIDFGALSNLIEFHVENNTVAIVVVGTTGESATLSNDEHCEVIRHAVKQANGRIPIIAGTGANSTFEAIQLTQFAKEVKTDACLTVTPYYNKPTQEGLYQHHKLIAETVDIPQILYNVPGRTACDMLPETVARLAKLKNIVGIKEASNDLNRVAQIKDTCPQDFMLVSGEDLTSKDFTLKGGDGIISVTANVAPKKMNKMIQYAISGETEKANQINEELIALHKTLFIESNPIPVKWALFKMGLIQAGIRLPLTWLAESFHDQVEVALQTAE